LIRNRFVRPHVQSKKKEDGYPEKVLFSGRAFRGNVGIDVTIEGEEPSPGK